MQQDQQMMIVMLLVVVALMLSRDTHKLFAETTRTWAQFGSSNYKAISALATIAMLAIGTGVYKNQQDIKDIFLKGRLLREKRTRDPIEVEETIRLTKKSRLDNEERGREGTSMKPPSPPIPPSSFQPSHVMTPLLSDFPEAFPTTLDTQYPAAQKRPADNWDITQKLEQNKVWAMLEQDKWDIMKKSPLWNRLPEDLQEKIQDEAVLRPLQEQIAASAAKHRNAGAGQTMRYVSPTAAKHRNAGAGGTIRP